MSVAVATTATTPTTSNTPTRSTPATTPTFPIPASARVHTATAATTPTVATPTRSAAPTATTPTATIATTPSAARPFNSTNGIARVPARAHSDGSVHVSNEAIALAAIAALLLLACAVWAFARSRAYEPHWLVSLRHAMAEAGFRTSATWAEFSDWIRLGH